MRPQKGLVILWSEAVVGGSSVFLEKSFVESCSTTVLCLLKGGTKAGGVEMSLLLGRASVFLKNGKVNPAGEGCWLCFDDAAAATEVVPSLYGEQEGDDGGCDGRTVQAGGSPVRPGDVWAE